MNLAGETKLPPFMIFKGTEKRELTKIFKRFC